MIITFGSRHVSFYESQEIHQSLREYVIWRQRYIVKLSIQINILYLYSWSFFPLEEGRIKVAVSPNKVSIPAGH